MLLHKTTKKVQLVLTLINQKLHTFCTNVRKCAEKECLYDTFRESWGQVRDSG